MWLTTKSGFWERTTCPSLRKYSPSALLNVVGAMLMVVAFSSSSCLAQDTTLSSSLSSAAPEKCMSWIQWSNPYVADANSSNAVDRMMAEPDVNKFCKDLTDKLGQLPAVLVPEDAPQPIKDAAAKLGPQVVDALLRKQGSLFVESFKINEMQEPENLKAGLILEVGADVDDTVRTITELLGMFGVPMETVAIQGDKAIKIELPPGGPFNETAISQQGDFIVITTSMEMLVEIKARMQSGKIAPWLSELQAKQSYERLSGIGIIDLAMLKEEFGFLMDEEVTKVFKALGLHNLKNIEFSGGYGKTDFAQVFALNFDGAPSGIFDAFSDEGLALDDIAHFPDDSFFAATMSVDGKKMLNQIQSILVQLEPDAAMEMASGMIQFQRETGIDLRQLIENFGPSVSVHNAFADGIVSGAMLKTKLRDPAAFDRTMENVVELAQREVHEFQMGVDSIEQNGKTIKAMRFGGVPIPVEPSWYVDGNQMTVALFPSVLSTVTNEDAITPLVKTKDFEPYLPLFQTDSDSKVVGFAYSETETSYEILYGYACLFSAMGKNMISGTIEDHFAGPLTAQQMDGLKELFGDLNLPSCRSIVRHLTPQITVVRSGKDAIVLHSHSSINSSNLTLIAPGIAVGMLLPAVQQVRSAARRTTSANNLRQLGLASFNFESAMGRFPSGDGPVKEGGPPVSWRVKILPYIEQANLYEQYNFDEPWDSENNRKLLEMMPEVFQNPASSAVDGYTVYRGISGPNGIMGDDGQGKSVGRRIAEVVDGTSNTIMFLETPDEMAVPWTKPDGGINPEEIEPWQMWGNFPGGFNAGFCDASVHFLSTSLDEELFKNLMKMNDGNVVGGF